jgi:hypothetical protein
MANPSGIMVEPRPACPRCGYDLSGVVASWHVGCPIEGTCSECGLEFSWRDVLDPRWSVPGWAFEHARRRVLASLVSSAARALWAWGFWRRIRMEHPIRGGRLGVWVVVMLLATHAVFGAYNGVYAYADISRARQQLISALSTGQSAQNVVSAGTVWRHTLRAVVWPYSGTITSVWAPRGGGWMWSTESRVPARVWLGPLAFSLFPLAYLVLGQTMRRARVRRAHLVRIWAYSLALSPLTLLVWLRVLPQPEPIADLAESLSYLVSPYVAPEWRYVPDWLYVLGEIVAAGGVFWWCATTRYLRLGHARLTAPIMTVIVGLATLTGLVVCSVWLSKMGY